MIDDTAEWLDIWPANTFVRAMYLALVRRRGTAEQAAYAIHTTAKWLAANPHADHVRDPFRKLVKNRGAHEPRTDDVEETCE